MFEAFASGKYEHDIEVTRKLNPKILTFEEWLVKEKDVLATEFP